MLAIEDAYVKTPNSSEPSRLAAKINRINHKGFVKRLARTIHEKDLIMELFLIIFFPS
jgi:hypothetical protein